MPLQYDPYSVIIGKLTGHAILIGSHIHHFHIDHNAPCLPPLTFCVTIVFDFSWDDEEKLETMVMQNLGDKQGASWST